MLENTSGKSQGTMALSEREKPKAQPDSIDEASLDGLDKDELVEIVSLMVSKRFSGPIPHPEILSGYENIVPGSADRIIKMAEKESEHRQELDNAELRIESRNSLLGILCAFFICIATFVLGYLIVLASPSTAGTIIGAIVSVSGIGAIVASFLKYTKK